ncbi:hypothetical protein AQ723_17775 [Burkholderia pseudomallei]|nr:hypothetical protein AQ723_17775 [Burkholderia pseudomallei]
MNWYISEMTNNARCVVRAAVAEGERVRRFARAFAQLTKPRRRILKWDEDGRSATLQLNSLSPFFKLVEKDVSTCVG